jgi:hypothetical protein
MKRLFLSLLIVTLIAVCGIFGEDVSDSDRFGVWEKVSSDRGEYRGIESSLSKVQVTTGASISSDSMETDTIQIIDDDQADISLIENSLTDGGHDALFKFEYSTIPHSSGGWKLDYVTDSTAFIIETNRFSLNESSIYTESRVTWLCGSQQADEEYVHATYFNKDTTRATIFSIRVDGMMDLVENIGITCKD